MDRKLMKLRLIAPHQASPQHRAQHRYRYSWENKPRTAFRRNAGEGIPLRARTNPLPAAPAGPSPLLETIMAAILRSRLARQETADAFHHQKVLRACKDVLTGVSPLIRNNLDH